MIGTKSETVDDTPAVARGLAGYVNAVAAVLALPTEGTSYEVSDTATAYLALARRSAERPGRDLMLVWSERDGWAVSVETTPTEPPIVISYLGGDPVPKPRLVASFVAEVLAGDRPGGEPTGQGSRALLASRLTPYAASAAS